MYQQTKDITITSNGSKTETILETIVSLSLKLAYPFAIYRLPHNDKITIVIGFKSEEYSEGKVDGFVISPFAPTAKKHFINSDIQIDIVKDEVSYKSIENEKSKSFIAQLTVQTQEHYSSQNLPSVQIEKGQNYVALTKEAINQIKEGRFKKVVTARRKTIEIDSLQNPAKSFLELVSIQPCAFVSLTYLPGNGIWLGASPELLISTDKNNIFRTVSLAGTQKAASDDISKAVWTQKEIEEQALVSRYIISCFKSIRLREYDEQGPKTVKSGILLHLKTEYSVNLNEVPFPNLGNQMLELLHPTSAVCGMPKPEALDFINTNEQLERKFYSGFLGPVKVDGETHIFVNIRCAEILNGFANLYSGAGITEESIAEREFVETDLKMQLMENLLSKKL